MSEIRQKIVKEFPAEMAGERVGWASTTETQREDGLRVLRVAGGYGEVGDEGASVSRREDEEGKQYFSSATPATKGISRACAWSFYVSKDGDSEWDLRGLKFQPSISVSEFDGMLSGNFSKEFAGLVPYGTISLENESEASWGVGNDEVLECIKGRLDEKGAMDVYSPMYIAINAVAGRYVYGQSRNSQILGEYLFPDVTQREVTLREIELLGEFESSMARRSALDGSMTDKINRQQFTQSDAVAYDAFSSRIEDAFIAFRSSSVIPQPFMCTSNLPNSADVKNVFDNEGALAVASAVNRNTSRLSQWSTLSGSSLVALRALHEGEK